MKILDTSYVFHKYFMYNEKMFVNRKSDELWRHVNSGHRKSVLSSPTGSAIGLGAIWKFPYMAGTNGGSVFVLLFIISTIAIGLPILLAEFVIGRMGQADVYDI